MFDRAPDAVAIERIVMSSIDGLRSAGGGRGVAAMYGGFAGGDAMKAEVA